MCCVALCCCVFSFGVCCWLLVFVCLFVCLFGGRVLFCVNCFVVCGGDVEANWQSPRLCLLFDTFVCSVRSGVARLMQMNNRHGRGFVGQAWVFRAGRGGGIGEKRLVHRPCVLEQLLCLVRGGAARLGKRDTCRSRVFWSSCCVWCGAVRRDWGTAVGAAVVHFR